MRLIDADELIRRADEDPQFAVWEAGVGTLARLVDTIPAIDPESLRPEWVSVKDRLPEENKDVLVFTELGKMAIGFYGGNNIYWYLYIGDNGEGGYELNGEKITHWAQLPKPPEGFEYREGWLPIAHYTYHGAQRF